MIKCKKRDGEVVSFKIQKIEAAIIKAFDAERKKYDDDIIKMIALRATSNFNDKIKDNTISVEDIQDAVEVALIQSGYVGVARAYIKYRGRHETLRQIDATT